jgi:hypothetical protein
LKHNDKIDGIYGSRYGVEGLIDDNLVDLRQEDLEEIELLKQTPGSALGQHPQETAGGSTIRSLIKSSRRSSSTISATSWSMAATIRWIPATSLSEFLRGQEDGHQRSSASRRPSITIYVTDHSIGFPSAARHVINFMKMAVVDAGAYKKGKVVLVEIMGRNAGWLTASVDILARGRASGSDLRPGSEVGRREIPQAAENHLRKKGFAVCAL